MADVVLFHSILGLRPAERQIAAEFEKHGHRVILPDLFGERFSDDYDAGFALRKEFTSETLTQRALAAVEGVPETAVFVGVSFGASMIDLFWEIRPKMAAVLLFAGTVNWMQPRRRGLRVSAHIARPDLFDDEDYSPIGRHRRAMWRLICAAMTAKAITFWIRCWPITTQRRPRGACNAPWPF